MGEADRAAGFHDARGDQRRHRRLQVGVGESGQPRGVADLRAVAERAERAGERGGGRRQPRQTEQHRVGDAARDDRADLGRGGRSGIEAAGRRLVEQLADEKRVAARHLEAGARRTDRRARSDSRAATSAAMAASVSGAGRSTSAAGSATSVAASGVSAGSSGRVARMSASGCPSSRRAMNASARADGASHHCRSSTTSASGASADEVRREPVQAVLPGVAGIAGGRTRRRRGARCGRCGEHLCGQRRRSRQPALALAGVGLEQRALEELAHDPERESLLELRRPRAEDATPRSGACEACLLEQPRLPHPRGALDDQGSSRSLPDGTQRGTDALDLVLALEQRSRLSDGGLVHAPVDRRPRDGPRAMFGGRCQGMCPMCAAPVGHGATHPAGDSVSLIQVKVIEGVFTTPQKREIVERLTDAMVEIAGREHAPAHLVRGRGGRQRRVGHRRADAHRR